MVMQLEQHIAGPLSIRSEVRTVDVPATMSDARTWLSSQLSGGMQRRLELVCELVHDPRLLFADEPMAGINPLQRSKFCEHFRELCNQGRTLFVTTHYVSEAAYCDLDGRRCDQCISYERAKGVTR